MAYVLIDGKRYYKDEFGNTSLDNVSQEEADRRGQRPAPPSTSNTFTYNNLNKQKEMNRQNDSNRRNVQNARNQVNSSRSKFSMKKLIVILVILFMIGAYVWSSVSTAADIIWTFINSECDVEELGYGEIPEYFDIENENC